MKKVLSISLVGLLLALLASTIAQASPPENFYLTKICPSLDNPNACDIQYADSPFEHLVGGQIIYFDRVYWENPAGHEFEIARVEVTTGDDTGQAIGQIRWIKDYGLFTFGQGSGSLAGLHANGRVEFVEITDDGRYVFSLTGTYHIDPVRGDE
jgi:hypothetical protein